MSARGSPRRQEQATHHDGQHPHHGRSPEQHLVQTRLAPLLLPVEQDPYRNGIENSERAKEQRLKKQGYELENGWYMSLHVKRCVAYERTSALASGNVSSSDISAGFD